MHKKICDKFSDKFKDDLENEIFKNTAEEEIFNDIKSTLKRIDIEFDQFYNEDDLYKKWQH